MRMPRITSSDHGHGPATHEPHHSLKAIAGFIERSALTREGKDRAIHLFRRLGEAEAAIHDVPLEQIHLHEVGALDSIIDIVGIVYGMDWLGADRIVASPLNVGSGTVKCAHGMFPGAGAGDGAAAPGRPGLRRRGGCRAGDADRGAHRDRLCRQPSAGCR